jgi:diaminopimelate epimerase
MTSLEVVKGHGTQNDFVLVPDVDDRFAGLLDPATVAALCDRRAGIGADGVIRVVPTATVADVADQAHVAPWFMDYRNADGSIAEMCGNGARVFARYLVDAGLVESDHFAIATRGGARQVTTTADGFAVTMGVPTFLPGEPAARVTVGEHSWSASGVFIPNPHAVVFVDDLAHAGDLLVPPTVTPASAFPHGVNVEFVVDVGPAHVAMRVHERGSGETRSCGTGAAAVAVAARRRAAGGGALSQVPAEWIVDVPGGRLTVAEQSDGEVVLAGPAVLVATGQVDLDRLGR